MIDKNKFENIISGFSIKQAKEYHLPVVLRLIDKLNENNIRDIEIRRMLSEISSCLNDILNGDRTKNSEYYRSFRALTIYTRKTYKYASKGTYYGIFIGFGAAISPLIGLLFLSIGLSAFLAATLLVIIIGVAMGIIMEKKAIKENRLF